MHPEGFIGILVLLGLALLISEDRRHFPLRLVVVGVLVQFVCAWLLLRFPPVVFFFSILGQWVNAVIASADAGSAFVFGDLSRPDGPAGFVFAFRVLPVIVFFASFMAVLYHLGIMQRVIAALAWLLRKTLGVTGTEAMAMAANVFVGQTEAPLCVRPFIPRMTRSQLATLMVGGFATIAGSVFAAYVAMLGGIHTDDPARLAFIKHLITASVLSAPAAFIMAKIIVPERETPIDEGLRSAEIERTTRNTLDAAAAGATDGLRLALNVAAMLVAFVALLALVNTALGALGQVGLPRMALDALGIETLKLEVMLGWLLAPLAWTMGIPWAECSFFGTLLGEKLVVTEFIAYGHLAADIQAGVAGQPTQLSPRSAAIAAYALCGFANFPSIAIQIGGLTALAPSRRSEFATLGLRAMAGGALASWMTAAIAGVLLP
ncbi:Nucleoside permease NupC [hydrothermal vent metagenome]|uniref:Nucleoside permease NupC n=1 Tax=hydrothermal vent metagenome TaxID=652676 RepID=A0A3B1DSV7_9ZZZZ